MLPPEAAPRVGAAPLSKGEAPMELITQAIKLLTSVITLAEALARLRLSSSTTHGRSDAKKKSR